MNPEGCLGSGQAAQGPEQNSHFNWDKETFSSGKMRWYLRTTDALEGGKKKEKEALPPFVKSPVLLQKEGKREWDTLKKEYKTVEKGGRGDGRAGRKESRDLGKPSAPPADTAGLQDSLVLWDSQSLLQV